MKTVTLYKVLDENKQLANFFEQLEDAEKYVEEKRKGGKHYTIVRLPVEIPNIKQKIKFNIWELIGAVISLGLWVWTCYIILTGNLF